MKLILNNIKKDYYREKKTYAVIDNITFNLLDGEIITIVGKSGCGKSTLLNIISGLDNKTGGEIFFNKKTPKISYMFQNDALLPYKNTLDNALLGLKLRKELDDNKLTSVKKMLIEYGLKEHLYKKIKPLKRTVLLQINFNRYYF
jgi:NitT/TauT family transport system ATP-binding protein